MNKKINSTRKIIITLLSFSLSVILALTGLLSVVSLTLLNPRYVVKSLQKSSFGEIELPRIKEHFISYGAAGNVEESFFIDYFKENITAETITNDMAKSIFEIYNGIEKENGNEFSNELYNALYKYAANMHMDVESKEIQAGIRQFADDLTALYNRYTILPYSETISPVIKRASKLMPLAIAFLSLFSIIISVIIFLSYKEKLNAYLYFASSLGGTGLMLTAFPLLILITKQAEKFTLTDEALRSFFIKFMNGVTACTIMCGVVFLIISTILYYYAISKKSKT
ncbi:MAG TPA: hypothetical protein VFC76_04545 [Oscillospiraceae bacterium]|nr:hypothetical protein [Oscillospiraceae bacterium]